MVHRAQLADRAATGQQRRRDGETVNQLHRPPDSAGFGHADRSAQPNLIDVTVSSAATARPVQDPPTAPGRRRGRGAIRIRCAATARVRPPNHCIVGEGPMIRATRALVPRIHRHFDRLGRRLRHRRCGRREPGVPEDQGLAGRIEGQGATRRGSRSSPTRGARPGRRQGLQDRSDRHQAGHRRDRSTTASQCRPGRRLAERRARPTIPPTVTLSAGKALRPRAAYRSRRATLMAMTARLPPPKLPTWENARADAAWPASASR